MYAQLSDSYEWRMLNKNGQVTERVQKMIAEGKSYSFQEIPTTFSILKNRVKSPIMTKLIEAVESGNIVMASNKDIRIPVYLPFILISTGAGKCKGIVFIDNCDTKYGEDELLLDARKLKVSLESCYFALQMFRLSASTKLHSPQIIRTATKMYTHIIGECINRKHSIKLDQDAYNKLIYLNSRYFIGTVLGFKTNPETMENYCLYNCLNADLVSIRRTVDTFEESDFKDISTYITKLSKTTDLQARLGKLTVSNFLESFINMYDSSMLLSLEVFPYFVYNIISVNEATYVNNYHILKNIVSDDGKKLYAALITSLCN